VSSGDLDSMLSVLLRVGSLGRILRENPALRSMAEPPLREALAGLGDPSRVELLASVWIVTAQTGAGCRWRSLLRGCRAGRMPLPPDRQA
jgi:hypothetical protein